MSGKQFTAKTITALLAQKHGKDVFVPECNLGSSWNRCRRMDAWAMRRSWADPVTWGYEIKVSRSDFLDDDKWHEYLEHCNEFYWVCPWGLIQPNEVGEGAGLMWVTKTGTRIIRKVKATRRDVGFSELVFRYVLMSRAQIVRDMHESNRISDRNHWENWLERREIDHAFGSRVGKAIRETVNEEVLKARRENERLQKKHQQYEDVRRVLEEMDIDPEQPPSTWALRRKVEEARATIPVELPVTISQCLSALQRMQKRIDELEGEA